MNAIRCRAALAALLILGGCATAPPPLPAGRVPVAAGAAADLATCGAIQADLAAVDGRMRAVTAQIEGDRSRDQAAGYGVALVSGLLFPPAMILLAADPNSATRQQVQALYAERDAVLARAADARCPLPGSATPPPASAPG